MTEFNRNTIRLTDVLNIFTNTKNVSLDFIPGSLRERLFLESTKVAEREIYYEEKDGIISIGLSMTILTIVREERILFIRDTTAGNVKIAESPTILGAIGFCIHHLEDLRYKNR